MQDYYLQELVKVTGIKIKHIKKRIAYQENEIISWLVRPCYKRQFLLQLAVQRLTLSHVI
jgi:hypothetical protein